MPGFMVVIVFVKVTSVPLPANPSAFFLVTSM